MAKRPKRPMFTKADIPAAWAERRAKLEEDGEAVTKEHRKQFRKDCERLIRDIGAVITPCEAFIDKHPGGVGHCTLVVKQTARVLGGWVGFSIRRVSDGVDVWSARAESDGLAEYVAQAAKRLSGGKAQPADPAVGEWKPGAVDNG